MQLVIHRDISHYSHSYKHANINSQKDLVKLSLTVNIQLNTYTRKRFKQRVYSILTKNHHALLKFKLCSSSNFYTTGGAKWNSKNNKIRVSL